MNKKYAHLLVLFIFFMHSSIYAEEKTNYLDYYYGITKAEQYFLQNEFDSSLNYYKYVFDQYPAPFAKDCFNALQIACFSGDTAHATYFFKMSFRYGVNWENLTHIPLVVTFLNRDTSYLNHIKYQYKKQREIYFSSIDLVMRDSVMAIMKNDFNKRAKYEKNDADAVKHYKDSVYTQALDSNIIAIFNLVKRHGYPGERMVGIHDTNYANSSRDKFAYRLSSLPAYMFFHHYCGYWLMQDYLLKAIYAGELHPKEYALIYEWSYATAHKRDMVLKYADKKSIKFYNTSATNNYKVSCDIQYQNKDKYYNLYLDRMFDNPDKALVNKCRKEVGIASLEHEQLKKEYGERNGLKLFTAFFERYNY